MELTQTSPSHNPNMPPRKFMYCLSPRDITPYFLLPTISLTRGILAICAFDIVVGMLVFFLFIIPEVAILGLNHNTGVCTLLLHLAQFICIIPSFIGITAIKGKHLSRAAIFMHWKIWEPVLLTVLQVLDLVMYGVYLKFRYDSLVIIYSVIWVVFLTIIRVMYDVYTAYATYSFIVLHEKGGTDVIQMERPKERDVVLEVQDVYKIQN